LRGRVIPSPLLEKVKSSDGTKKKRKRNVHGFKMSTTAVRGNCSPARNLDTKNPHAVAKQKKKEGGKQKKTLPEPWKITNPKGRRRKSLKKKGVPCIDVLEKEEGRMPKKEGTQDRILVVARRREEM